MTDEKKEEYNSTHDGPTIDAAVTRASEGGSIDAAIQAKPNPNLLDNWYFGNPVNQRGHTEYNTMSYAIDRWRTWDEPTSVCLKVVEGGIQIAYALHQFHEAYVYKALIGKNVTISVLFADGKLFYKTFKISESASEWYSVDVSYGGVSSVKLGIQPSDTTDLVSNFFRVNVTESGTLSNTILAVKLELGSQQTLAHQENSVWQLNETPDYGEQLARCQRYFQTFATESLRPTNALDFRPVMRATPALSTITVGGKTLYTASADL